MDLDPTEKGLDLLIGRTIVSGDSTPEGLHLTLDDGNIFVVIGTFYAGLALTKQSLQ